MKRIIDGKTYNTQTALHVATASFEYERKGKDWRCQRDLYRTKGRALFLVDVDTTGYDATEHKRVTFWPISYDDAYDFVLGRYGRGNHGVELLAHYIFPSIQA
jgi:hypothetical protein